ncbi:MAG: hypothetical protein AAGD11_09860 [Planctomycetota bacterium]
MIESREISSAMEPNMAMPKKGLRKLVIDGKGFYVSVKGRALTDAGDVPLSFVVHLEGNDRAKLLIKGITSRDYWIDFPDIEKYSDRALTLTPKSIVAVIRHCIAEGWEPDGTGQTNVQLDNSKLESIIAAAQVS